MTVEKRRPPRGGASPAPVEDRAGVRRIVTRLAAVVVAVAAALTISRNGFIDLNVYRVAGQAYLDGVGLYGAEFHSRSSLSYIYGPVGAVAMVPLALVPQLFTQVLWTALGVAVLWWVLRTVCDRLGLASTSATALLLLTPAVLVGPVRDTLGYGQINLLLMGLVVLDATGVLPKRSRGVGIGLAAAVKMTPAAFGLLLLVRKDYPSVVRAAGAFLLAGAAGFVFAPADSREYWTVVFFDTGRGGSYRYGPNQAITGILARMGLVEPTATVVWLGAVVLVVAAAAYAARKFTASGEHVLALGVVALAALLASPLSVSHHWVYVALLLPLLLAPQYRSWRYPLAGAAIVFFLSLHNEVPMSGERELHWNPVQQVLGNSEGVVGMALLVAAVVVAHRRRPALATDVTAVERVVQP